MSVEAKDDISEEDEEIPSQSSQNDGECREEKSSRPSSNIYTPLLTDARLSTSVNASTSKLDKDISKDRINKPNLEVVSHQTRIQRSSVRPFFCCGSEVSLVSLVDNLQLEDQQPTGLSKPNKIECTESSSDEEESALNCNQSLKSSVAPSSRSLLRKKKKDKHVAKKKFWSLRLRGRWNTHWKVSQPQRSGCHRVDMSHSSKDLSQGTYTSIGSPGTSRRVSRPHDALNVSQLMNPSQIHNIDSLYPLDDTVRIREIDEELGQSVEIEHNLFSQTLGSNLDFSNSMLDMLRQRRLAEPTDSESSRSSPGMSSEEDYSLIMNNFMLQLQGSRNVLSEGNKYGSLRVYTQVDYMHCLVPCLVKITSCPFYWGIMDRYEAERHLDNKPEGTFLLRDSAQEDFLFSVSFRRYNRSLHARVEQLNHQFSFDAHDPCVFSAPSVCELMEHYKDPSSCMFFEPMLTRPLSRNFTFTLQHICRAVICDVLVYDQIHDLPIPNSLKLFLQTYHYKEKVRVRHFDGSGNQVMID